jgi:hypothetical protein
VNTVSIIVSLLVSKRHELNKVLLVSEFLFSVPVRHGKGGIVEFMAKPSAHTKTLLVLPRVELVRQKYSVCGGFYDSMASMRAFRVARTGNTTPVVYRGLRTGTRYSTTLKSNTII